MCYFCVSAFLIAEQFQTHVFPVFAIFSYEAQRPPLVSYSHTRYFEVTYVKNFRFPLLAVLMLLVLPAVMHAQSGCSDSPEAPTDVLMLVGAAGMIFGSSAAMKLVRKIRK